MSPMRLLPALPLLLVACGSGDPGTDPDTDSVTYYQHVKPIMDAKCARCHFDGGIAPFALEDYEDAAQHDGVAQLAVNDGIMPPWLAVDGCNDYVGDYSLTSAEKELINAWVDGGSEAGDPSNEGDPVVIEDLSLSRVDLELEMPVDYTPTNTPDDYRCFVIEWPEEFTDTKYVTGFNAVPGNLEVVHHVIAFLAEPGDRDTYVQMDAAEEGPGYTCFGGTGGPAQTWIGSWAPGTEGRDLPPGSGIAIEPGSTIVLQVHYNVIENNAGSDRTSIQVSMADTVEREGRVQPWTNPSWLSSGMEIPANDSDVMHAWQFDPTPFVSNREPILIHSVGFHMHQLGTSGTLRVKRATGEDECLVEIDRWDFNWQNSYALRTPLRFEPGDQLYIECHWDNSLENQPIVNGSPQIPRDVAWGEGTGDEMCLSGFYWTPAD